jgi:hypothetical protein
LGLCILKRKIPVFHWQRIIFTKHHVYRSFLKDTPHKRGLRSIINNGKTGSPLIVAACVNINAATGDVMDISGFVSGSGVIKYSADFEFPLRRDEEEILENL